MDTELRGIVLKVLTSVSPDINPDEIKPDVNFRDQFDFDSLDFLNFATGLQKATGIVIPESDYPQLISLDSSIRYLQKMGRAAPRSMDLPDGPSAK